MMTYPLIRPPRPLPLLSAPDPAGCVCRRHLLGTLGPRPCHRTPLFSARAMKRRSAAPTPKAPGIGSSPTTPARRRRSFSCANSVRRCAPAQGRPRRCSRCSSKLAALLPSQTRRSEEMPGIPAIFDADRARLCGRHGRRRYCGRYRSRALGRDRPARDLRRTRRRHACCSTNSPTAAPVCSRELFPGTPRHTIRRGAHPRPSRCGAAAERRADEPALLGGRACRDPRRRCRTSPHRLGVGAPRRGWAARRDHRRQARRPTIPAWRDGFVRLQECGRVVFSAAIDGRVYARHGTTIDTRLTVIDRVPADDPAVLPGARRDRGRSGGILLDWVTRLVPPRPRQQAGTRAFVPARSSGAAAPRQSEHLELRPAASSRVPADAVEIAYEPM